MGNKFTHSKLNVADFVYHLEKTGCHFDVRLGIFDKLLFGLSAEPVANIQSRFECGLYAVDIKANAIFHKQFVSSFQVLHMRKQRLLYQSKKGCCCYALAL